MVSNAREDLPEPESPVITVSVLRGIATVMSLRLCSRAPRTMRESPDIAMERTQGHGIGSIVTHSARHPTGGAGPSGAPGGSNGRPRTRESAMPLSPSSALPDTLPAAAPAPESIVSPRPLVVVSNRLPFTAERGVDGIRFARSSGGLVAALDPVLAQRGGVWVGWPGLEQEPDDASSEIITPVGSRVRYRPVTLSGREVAAYYGGFSNRTLWPLFHYLVDRTRIDSHTWTAYEQVNERFARAAAEASGDDDQVW